MEKRDIEKSRVSDKDRRLSRKPAARPKKEEGEKSHYQDRNKAIRTNRPDKNMKGLGIGKDQRYERSERHERGERYSKSERYAKPERGSRGKKPQKYERSERHEKYERRDRSKREAKTTESDTIRLNKFIANSGVCSRREADDYIKTGLVTVNGKVVTELGTKVNPDDDIRFNGERLKGEKKVYLLMNKPKDYVTTMSDPYAKKCVIDLISPEKCKERVVPVGRLDKATTGVLLFTNDGDLAARLTHPSYNVKKIYHVFLDKNLKKNDFDALVKGITLEDGEIHADSLSYVDNDMSQVGIEIHSGRNRIVRRMFEHLGYKVIKLDRVYFAGLTKKKLRRGAWRFLTEQEVAFLKMGNFNN